MDDTKQIRAKLLADFIARHGGASHVLSKVLDPGSKDFKSKMSYMTQCSTDGFGERSAAKWEDLLQPVGMASGYLKRPHSDEPEVNARLSAVRTSSVKNYNLAHVFEWAQMGEVLFTERGSLTAGEYREKTDAASPSVKWFRSEDDMPRLRIKRGWQVAISPITDASTCRDGETYAFSTPGGSFFLGDFRRLADGYEAIPDSGPPLDTERHGIKVVGEYCGSVK